MQFSPKIHKVLELKMDALVAVNIIQDVYDVIRKHLIAMQYNVKRLLLKVNVNREGLTSFG